jgi:uncharacterized small protein (DUF1192 family)
MAIDDEEAIFGAARPKARAVHVMGEPLDTLSAPELKERIDALKREIERLEGAIKARAATREAADTFFKS